MSNITRWDPFRELEEMQHRLAPFWGREAIRKSDKDEMLLSADWTPAVDITEDDNEYVIRAELPGIRKEDIRVSLDDNVLSISGERTMEKEEKGKRHHRVERSYGKFVRSFTLPERTDNQHIKAEHKDGVLTVHLMKSEEQKPRQIEVKVV
jgi:HSP20 family protein